MGLYQVCSNFALWVKKMPRRGVTLAYIKSTFPEYGHVAYQIKGNEAYNSMLANISLKCTLDPRVGSKDIFSFYESSHVAYQINGDEVENTMQAKHPPFHTPGWGQKVKHFF